MLMITSGDGVEESYSVGGSVFPLQMRYSSGSYTLRNVG